MCFEERWTESRTLEPPAILTARRTRASRRPTALRSCAIIGSRSFLLAFLAEDVLACVFDALALVGLRRPERADLGRDLPDLLLVDSGHYDLGRSRRRDCDALGDRIAHVVAEPERDLQVLALHGGTIADAADFEALLESLGHAGDQIVDERARQAPHGACTLGLGARLDHDAAALHLRRDVVVKHDFDRALLALAHGRHPWRPRDRLPADARHGFSSFAQNTVHRISPPTFWSRASWSAMTPLGVERIETPRPLLMRGRFLTEA